MEDPLTGVPGGVRKRKWFDSFAGGFCAREGAARTSKEE